MLCRLSLWRIMRARMRSVGPSRMSNDFPHSHTAHTHKWMTKESREHHDKRTIQLETNNSLALFFLSLFLSKVKILFSTKNFFFLSLSLFVFMPPARLSFAHLRYIKAAAAAAHTMKTLESPNNKSARNSHASIYLSCVISTFGQRTHFLSSIRHTHTEWKNTTLRVI